MELKAGAPVKGTAIDVAFVGSCTNGRLSDLNSFNKIQGHKVKENVKAIVVPGSQIVSQLAQEKGLDEIFKAAGFEWANAGALCAWP